MPAAAAIASTPQAILNASTSSSVKAMAMALDENPIHEPWRDQTRGQRDLVTQLVISSVLGLGAFFSFCVCLCSRSLGL